MIGKTIVIVTITVNANDIGSWKNIVRIGSERNTKIFKKCKLFKYGAEFQRNGCSFHYNPMVYVSDAQTFWLVGHICVSENLRGPQEL